MQPFNCDFGTGRNATFGFRDASIEYPAGYQAEAFAIDEVETITKASKGSESLIFFISFTFLSEIEGAGCNYFFDLVTNSRSCVNYSIWRYEVIFCGSCKGFARQDLTFCCFGLLGALQRSPISDSL